jgi:hypothetical protein
MITAITLFIVTGFVYGVFASGLQFSGFTPANGSVTGNASQQIGVDITGLMGVPSAGDLSLTVGGQAVTPVIAEVVDGVRVTYTPAEKLGNGVQLIQVEVTDGDTGELAQTQWSFTVDAAPKASNHLPAIGSTVNIYNPKIELYVKDSYDYLNESSLKVWLDGNLVSANWEFKGKWIYYDPCAPPIWSITDRKEGTVRFNAPYLEFGEHTVKVEMADVQGNLMVEEWTFTVLSNYTFGTQRPTPGTTIGTAKPEIYAWVYAPNGAFDTDDVVMTVGGNTVTPTLTYHTNYYKIAYQPEVGLNGNYPVVIDVYHHGFEEYQRTQWSFSVDALPKATSWIPAKGSTINTMNRLITLDVRDTFDHINPASLTAKLNGTLVNATFEFSVDTCDESIIYYNAGRISYNATGLPDGTNTFEVSIADVLGNVMTESWSFNVAVVPVVSQMYPENGSELASVSVVSAVVTDNSGVDWDRVNLRINNSVVAHTVDESTGTVSYSANLADNSYQVRLEVYDLAGNRTIQTWSFVVVSSPPSLTQLLYFKDHMLITNGVLRFQAYLTHLVDIKDNVTLKLNGEPLDIGFRYQGFYDTCGDGAYIVTSEKAAYVNYNKLVPDGEHTLELYAEDIYGSNRTWTWSFTVLSPPTITGMAPMKYGVTELQPVISATVRDNDEFASIVFTLNGEVIEDYDYNPENGKLSYTPPAPLANEMNYNVSLTATDVGGLVASKTWQFTINTYPDMADSNIENCLSCHEFKNSRSAPYEAVHPNYPYFFDGHDGTAYCGSCHGNVIGINECGACHNHESANNELWMSPLWPPHGYNPDKTYTARKVSDSVSLRVPTNRENWDCIICHQPGAGTKKRVGTSYVPLNHHDIPQLHRADADHCSDCHAMSLTREHARDGRTDENGLPITCLTCHDSARDDVKTAISAQETDCGACHGIGSGSSGHAATHGVNMGEQCVNCHGDNMIGEKIYHGNDCAGCHKSEVPKVKEAISLQNRTCFGCHEEPHGVKMIAVRDDIPFYGGVRWSKPDPTRIWRGEGWLPSELDNDMAVVLFSGTGNFNQETVYQYYTTEMSSNNWTLISESGEGDTFRLLFRKGRRHCLIWLYSGMSPLSGGSQANRILQVYN